MIPVGSCLRPPLPIRSPHRNHGRCIVTGG